MKILIDMNLSPTWVPFLADHGIEGVQLVERRPRNRIGF